MDDKPKYNGILADKFTAEEINSDDFFKVRKAALMKHYDIEYHGKQTHDDGGEFDWKVWHKLAMALAHDHVPGCQIEVKPGRKSERVIEDFIILFNLTIAALEGKSIRGAAMHLEAKHPEWRMKKETIARRYYNMQNGSFGAAISQMGAPALHQTLVSFEATIDSHSLRTGGRPA